MDWRTYLVSFQQLKQYPTPIHPHQFPFATAELHIMIPAIVLLVCGHMTHGSCLWASCNHRIEWHMTVCLYLGAGTASGTQFIDDLLHSLLPFRTSSGGQTKGCREVEVFQNWRCAHHDIVLSPVLESKKKHNRHGKWWPCQTSIHNTFTNLS